MEQFNQQMQVSENNSNKGKRITVILIIVVVFLALGWYAFNLTNRNEEKKTSQYSPTTSDDINYQSRTPVVNSGNVNYPNDWPSDVPKHPDGQVKVSGAMGGDVSVTLAISKPVQTVADFYKQELLNNGWQLSAEMATGGGIQLFFGKDERVTFVYVVGNDGTSQVTISLGRK